MNSTISLGVFLFLGIMIVAFMMGKKIKSQKINFKYVYYNFVILFLLALMLLILFFFPGVLEAMLLITGITSSTSLVFTSVLAYLFYNSFLQEIKIARQNEQIEKLARIISVQKVRDRGNENEKNRN